MSDTERPTPDVAVSATTGLPELPENYFWEVKQHDSIYEGMTTTLYLVKRTKRKYWFDAVVVLDYKRILFWDRVDDVKVYLDVDDYEQRVLETAQLIMTSHEHTLKMTAYYRLANAKLEKLVGKYPPKKLGE